MNTHNVAQQLLKQYGIDSLSYFALNKRKRFFFSSTGNSFLSYTIRHKTAIVSGDPVGPASEIPLLLKEFTYFVKGANLTTCFVAVNKHVLNQMTKLGYQNVHIGNEAILELSQYRKALLKKKVRRAERHILSQGITFHIYQPQDLPPQILRQMKMVNKDWLQDKGSKEKRFTMTLGRIPTSNDHDCQIVLAMKNKKVWGYLTFVPIYATHSLSLDAARRKKDAPNGLTEFLLIKAFEHFQKQGIQKISLNFAPFDQQPYRFNASISKILKTVAYKFLRRIYQTNKLSSFNNKFLPQWQERYVVFEKKRYIPNYLWAIATVEL